MNEHNLVSIGKNVYLSKNDPRFLYKYLQYFPKDPHANFEYGRQLYHRGEAEKALNHLFFAAQKGHGDASSFLAKVKREETEREKLRILSEKEREKEDRRSKWLATGLMTLLLLLLLFFTTSLLHERSLTDQQAYQFHPEVSSEAAVWAEEQLPYYVTHNALYRYYEKKGLFPDELDVLIGGYPNNWLSFIPEGGARGYRGEGETYSVIEGTAFFEAEGTIPLLELHLFPDSHRLSLVLGEDVLATYPVAVGKEELPFKKSKVTLRVVEPKGVNEGIFGTRGLALEEDYAIHGTNNPAAIGKNVTAGCIRMFNEHLEELYPYVALGTPLVVKEGHPDKAYFAGGLPALKGVVIAEKEMADSDTLFAWKY